MEQDDFRGTARRRLEVVGVSAFVLAMAFLFIGQAAERYASQLQPPATQLAKSKPIFNTIDYATTGAVKNATVIIGPCDTRRP